jgi:hypothetical protein
MKTSSLLSVALASTLFFTGCNEDKDDKKITVAQEQMTDTMIPMDNHDDMNNHMDEMGEIRQYKVTVLNLTVGQPFAPAGIILHSKAYHAFDIGMPASEGLEKLAEGGALTDFLGQTANNEEVKATAAGTGLILPGQSETAMIEAKGDAWLSLAAMLVKTNDGFTGLHDIYLKELEVGQTWVKYAPTFDAGTEANTESAATLPGLEGEGFNATRDDNNIVTIHSGVVTIDDGLVSSGLDNMAKFDNPTAVVKIERIK